MVRKFINKWKERIREYTDFYKFLQEIYFQSRKTQVIRDKSPCTISPTAVFTGPLESLKIGEGTIVGSYCFFRFREGNIEIGQDVIFANHVNILAATHNYHDPDIYIKDQGLRSGSVVIEDNVWIGAQVVILPNVRIGKGAVIGAGSIVTKDIPENEVWAGNPAKFLKKRLMSD